MRRVDTKTMEGVSTLVKTPIFLRCSQKLKQRPHIANKTSTKQIMPHTHTKRLSFRCPCVCRHVASAMRTSPVLVASRDDDSAMSSLFSQSTCFSSDSLKNFSQSPALVSTPASSFHAVCCCYRSR
ncbi:hypothetical protein CEXT_77861 [Caerostris extrusa]|uniref:Uncharacterized protein n=1 Tax=Caerostris extrusa TaxID=172846 RepID=A0AAV4U5I9_CAEEX|nr:hypothetical protein CEXT_77861 [Caerostris extrusa]